MSSHGAAERFRGLVGRMRASWRRRPVYRIGLRTVTAGSPHVENNGFIQIGDDCCLSSHPVQTHLVVMPNARLIMGDHVFVSYGAAISAKCSIRIGDGTRIGPFSLILDNDFHAVGDRDALGGTAPIDIGPNVVIGARVTVLRGARIGEGAHVMSGSTVAGVVASGTVVAGVPARVGGNDSGRALGRSVASIVMRVFRLAALPGQLDGPAHIAGWADIGWIRLLLALEETFGVTLSEERMRAARSVADVVRIVALAGAGHSHSSPRQ